MGPNHHGHARSRFPALLALLAAVLVLASCASNPRLEVLAPAQAPPGGSMAGDPPWTMHVIDNPNFRLPNGLDSADADGDGDGDLDIAANCEEFDSPFKVHLAVVWFENPLR